MKKVLLPTLFVFFFVAEGILVALMPGKFSENDIILVPHFLLIFLLFLTIYLKRLYGIIYGLVFGLLFDVVYTEILGIYLFMFPLTVYLVSGLMKVLQSNIVIACIVSIFGVAFLEFGVYGLSLIINITEMDLSSFIQSRLLPTLLFNFIFAVIFSYPFKRYFEKYKEAIMKE